MHDETACAEEAPASVLAMIVAANGRVDERELQAIDQLGGFGRLGVSRDRFVEMANACLADVGCGLCEHAWLRDSDVQYIDRLLDEVTDPEQRLLVCRLATAAMAADGRVTPDEQMVYAHALARWHVSQAPVVDSTLDDHPPAALSAI